MPPRIYSPFHYLPLDGEDKDPSKGDITQMNISDQTLVEYVQAYFRYYRQTVDEFFPQLRGILSLYAHYPFHTYVVRMGPNGVIIGHCRAEQSKIEVRRFQDFDPPFETPKIIHLCERLQLEHCWFDCTARTYDPADAEIDAIRIALEGALEAFWRSIPSEEAFADICDAFLKAERVHFQNVQNPGNAEKRIDKVAEVVLQEPAGFRRVETWGFQYKHYPVERISSASLREAEALFLDESAPDILCLVTSDDLTSVSRYIAADNERIRVWDRSILNRLANDHLDILRDYLKQYPNAVQELTRRTAKEQEQPDALFRELGSRLQCCPPGRETFMTFESIGIEFLTTLFTDELGPPKPQIRTLDGTQRRDVLFRNNRILRFFNRLIDLCGADSIIVDFKNYAERIEPPEINDVCRYTNKALGRFVLVVSRKGATDSTAETQHRQYRDYGIVCLVIDDDDLIEMADRKCRHQKPEDVLEDKLDELLHSY